MSDAFPLCAPWATVEDMEACGGEITCDDEVAERALRVSTYILYLQSRRKYPGVCSRQVLPCANSGAPGMHVVDGWNPSWGSIQPWGWCCQPRHTGLTCSCSRGPSQITLGVFPVREVLAVEIDGVILSADEYRVIGDRYLLRMADADGNPQCWPSTQRLDLPLGDIGTWAVTVAYGTEPPEAGVLAAAEYARQLCLACGGSAECVLPARVQTVARQGVQLAFMDPLAFLTNGLVGLPIADAWLTAERVGDRDAQTMFINPDDHVRAIPNDVLAS